MHQAFCDMVRCWLQLAHMNDQRLITGYRVKPCCFVVLQVPQECPQVISDMVALCMSQEPGDRPTAQQIICIIESTMANTRGETSCVIGLLGKPSGQHLGTAYPRTNVRL